MTNLARGVVLAAAREAAHGTYLAPTFSIPFNKATYETVSPPLRDESIRGNDSVLQGLYGGMQSSTWDLEVNGYADIVGHFLRIVGPDTVTAATTTTMSAGTSAGATSISTAASIPAGSTIRIDTAGDIEYAVTGAPSGAGPYTIPIASPVGGLTKDHSSGAAVTTTTTHTFAQSLTPRPPSFSFSVSDGVDYRGWAGCTMSELAIKIDPKATVTFAPKFIGFAEHVVSSFSPTWTDVQPMIGWNWAQTQNGGASTRGISLDLTFKRATEAIWAATGVQDPREVFSGALELDGTYKAIYEDTADMALFLGAQQVPIVTTLTKALPFGGESLQITMSKAGLPKGVRDLGQTYIQASFDLSAIHNATDSGITKVVLKNFVTAQY